MRSSGEDGAVFGIAGGEESCRRVNGRNGEDNGLVCRRRWKLLFADQGESFLGKDRWRGRRWGRVNRISRLPRSRRKARCFALLNSPCSDCGTAFLAVLRLKNVKPNMMILTGRPEGLS